LGIKRSLRASFFNAQFSMLNEGTKLQGESSRNQIKDLDSHFSYGILKIYII